MQFSRDQTLIHISEMYLLKNLCISKFSNEINYATILNISTIRNENLKKK